MLFRELNTCMSDTSIYQDTHKYLKAQEKEIFPVFFLLLLLLLLFCFFVFLMFIIILFCLFVCLFVFCFVCLFLVQVVLYLHCCIPGAYNNNLLQHKHRHSCKCKHC